MIVYKMILGGGFKYFSFSPLHGEKIHLTIIFFKWVKTTNQIRIEKHFQFPKDQGDIISNNRYKGMYCEF